MRLEFLKNFPMGLFLGMLIATLSFLILDNNYLGEWGKYFAYSISAMTTLAGAGIALYGVFLNIQNQQLLEEQRRKQSLAAAKATLPLAMSNLISIARRGVEISLDIETDGSTRVRTH